MYNQHTAKHLDNIHFSYVQSLFDTQAKLIRLRGYNLNHNKNRDYNKAKIPVEHGWNVPSSQGLSQHEAADWTDNGGWLGLVIPVGYIVVDIDDREEGNLLLETLESEGLNFYATRTMRGFQFFFRDTGTCKAQRAKVMTDAGFCVDYRLASKGQVVLPTGNTEGRVWIRCETNSDLSPLPFWLNELRSLRSVERDFELPLKEGSRNDTLFSHGCRLKFFGRTAEEIAMTLEFINGNLIEEPVDDHELSVILNSVGNQPSSLKAKGIETDTYNHTVFASSLLESFPSFTYGERIYTYMGGVYVPNGQYILEKAAQDGLGIKATTSRITEVINWIRRDTRMTEVDWFKKVNPDNGFLNVRNGLLNWRTGELLPHDPDMFFTVQIPVDYVPDAVCRRIDLFFKTLVPQDTVPVLEELVGYCLLPSLKYQKAFLLKGKGNNGKSTFLDLVGSFIGHDHVSRVPIHDLGGNRFAKAELQDKLMNIYDDLDSSVIKETGAFKALVCGEKIMAERKGKDPFTLKSMATLLYAANELPPSNDNSLGYRRRWIIVPFTLKLNKRNAVEGFVNQLMTTSELSGLLKVAVAALRRVEKQGGFSENESTKAAHDDFTLESNNVLRFLSDECELISDEWLRKKDLYKAYKTYCTDGGYIPFSMSKFYDLVVDGTGITESRHGSSNRVFKGVKCDVLNHF